MQGQLPLQSAAAHAPLDALFRSCLPWAKTEIKVRRWVWGYLLFQAMLMLLVRISDGNDSFLEGAVARGWSILLLLQFHPLAIAVARNSPSPWSTRSELTWARSLASLRGYSVAMVEQRAKSVPWLSLRDFLGPASVALLLWPGVLLLGDTPTRFALRLLVLVLLGLLSSLSGLVLFGLGGIFRRYFSAGYAPWVLLLVVWGPWVLGELMKISAISLPGLFLMVQDAVLGLAPLGG